MDRFLTIEAFVTVAQAQSFAEAARQMRLSKSVVTARVQQLEEFVGAPLFHRNTRNVRLSEVGQAFLQDCIDLVGRTDALTDQMRELKGSLAGRLRVHALPGFTLGHMATHLREFQDRYPEIVLDIFVNDAVVDPIKEGFDCALQIFRPSSEDLVERKIFPLRRVFCASPAYLARHGTPRHPRDLLGHRLGLYSGYPTRDKLVFQGAPQKIVLDLKPTLLSNSVHLLNEYACEHAGIVCIPTLVASKSMIEGHLVPVLPNWPLSSFWLSAVYSRSHRGGAKLRLFIESLLARYADEQPWDSVLISKGLLAPATNME